MALSALISAWLAGLLGGAHCVAMCGGFVAALAAARSPAGAVPLRRSGALVLHQLPYHAGRIASYALVGAAFGAVGGLALAAPSLLSLQRGLYVVANVFLLVLAVAIATGAGGNGRLQQAGGALFSRLVPAGADAAVARRAAGAGRPRPRLGSRPLRPHLQRAAAGAVRGQRDRRGGGDARLRRRYAAQPARRRVDGRAGPALARHGLGSLCRGRTPDGVRGRRDLAGAVRADGHRTGAFLPRSVRRPATRAKIRR